MTIERTRPVGRHSGGLIVFCCDSPECHEYIDTHTDEFSEALVSLRAERWTATATTDKRSVKSWEHFCQQCSDEIARVKEDALDTLLKGVPKK